MRIETVKIPADNAKGYKIVNADDPRALEMQEGADTLSADDYTPEVIDKMGKPEVRAILDAHGTEYDARSKVAGLREIAKRVMFVSL